MRAGDRQGRAGGVSHEAALPSCCRVRAVLGCAPRILGGVGEAAAATARPNPECFGVPGRSPARPALLVPGCVSPDSHEMQIHRAQAHEEPLPIAGWALCAPDLGGARGCWAHPSCFVSSVRPAPGWARAPGAVGTGGWLGVAVTPPQDLGLGAAAACRAPPGAAGLAKEKAELWGHASRCRALWGHPEPCWTAASPPCGLGTPLVVQSAGS